jgi:hypothetical protein
MAYSRRLLWTSLLLLGCGTQAPAPASPTWAEDVLPILRGNCFGCHGATANWRLYQTRRWDVYDRTAEPYIRLGFGPVTEASDPGASVVTVGAKDVALFLPIYVAGPDDVRQPPPPAPRLSARDIEVLRNWVSHDNPNPLALGSHHPNHQAAIGWLDRGARRVTVTDQDGDTVVGKLDCSGTEVGFDHSGAFTLPAGVSLPCAGSLYDGFEETSVSLN